MALQLSDQLVTGNTNEIEYAGVRIALENCLFPQDAIDETPSQKDGLDKSTENDLRRIGCEFIQIAGIMLKVPQVAMASAQVLFQRFFFAKSFVKHKMEEIAMACIWLASKVEECPRRVRDVINVFHYLRLQRNKSPATPMVLDQDYVNLKNNVIKAERRVLKELGFCVHVKHPHKIIVVYLQVLELEKNRELVQTAWNYMNDSLQTTVFVQYNPETIACACIYLAARVLQIPLPNKTHWFYLFNATEEDIQKICVTLLCVYQTMKTPYEVLEKKVEDCREVLQKEKQKVKDAIYGEGVNKSAANSPASRPSSPATNTPKDSKQQSGRSSTVPTNREQSNSVVANGDKKRNRDDSRIRRSHDSGIKRSRTRSASTNRSSKLRKQSSSTSSSSEDSSPERREGRNKGRSSDMLPKSYSHQNSNRLLEEERRRRRRRKEGKSRHSKPRHDERDGHKSRDSSRSRRQDSANKKHKRKLSTGDVSPNTLPLNHVNGDSPSSRKSHKHRSDRDSRRKKKSRHSPSHSLKR
ncbi:cyclin-L2-like isoform X1 [Styela clava]